MATDGLNSYGRIPKPSGRYAVGCIDVMTSPGAEGVFFRLFYPTAAVEGADSPNWLPDKKYLEGYAKYFKMWPPMFTYTFPVLVGDIDVPAFWNTPPITDDNQQKFPVMVYSHGLGACRTTYTTICLEVASNGYVVAAVEHRDFSAAATFYFEDGSGNDKPKTPSESLASKELVENKKKYIFMKEFRGDSNEPTIRNKQVHIRSRECILVLDWLQSLNDGGDVKSVLKQSFPLSQFQGLLDFSKASICGHSFGGSTVIVTMAEDKRFKVGVALDPWMLPLTEEKSLFNDLTQQMLFINTEIFQTEDDMRIIKEIESICAQRLKVTKLKGTLHLNQSDVPFICRSALRWYLGTKSRLSRFVAMDLTTRLTMVFLSKHLDLPVNENYVNYLETHREIVEEDVPLLPEPARRLTVVFPQAQTKNDIEKIAEC